MCATRSGDPPPLNVVRNLTLRVHYHCKPQITAPIHTCGHIVLHRSYKIQSAWQAMPCYTAGTIIRFYGLGSLQSRQFLLTVLYTLYLSRKLVAEERIQFTCHAVYCIVKPTCGDRLPARSRRYHDVVSADYIHTVWDRTYS